MAIPIRVGVIGAGAIAVARHLPAFHDCQEAGEAELVAVADPVTANARQAAERFGVPHIFANYQDLLRLPLDAVSICTPNVYHEPIALAALALGKHVLCEKPLAMTYAGARQMHERAEQAGVTTAVNFRYRFIPAAGFVRDLIQGGELGEIYHVYANYFNGGLHDPATPIHWRETRAEAGSGALGDLASHLIDLCRFWIGEIASVRGHLHTFTTERPLTTGGTGQVDVDDATSFLVRFAGGAEGVLNASRCAIGRNNHQRVEIYGTKGALIYEIEKWDQGGTQVQVCLGSAQARHGGFATVNVPPAYLAGHPQRAMADFIEAIATGGPMTPNFYDGMRCQEVIEAVERSADHNGWVELPL
ncbi:MAG: Gfo/Idh/MocA family protein [Thermomicrobiales bacterium]